MCRRVRTRTCVIAPCAMAASASQHTGRRWGQQFLRQVKHFRSIPPFGHYFLNSPIQGDIVAILHGFKICRTVCCCALVVETIAVIFVRLRAVRPFQRPNRILEFPALLPEPQRFVKSVSSSEPSCDGCGLFSSPRSLVPSTFACELPLSTCPPPLILPFLPFLLALSLPRLCLLLWASSAQHVITHLPAQSLPHPAFFQGQ